MSSWYKRQKRTEQRILFIIKFYSWESESGLTMTKVGHIKKREAVVSVRVDNLDSRVVSVKSKVDERSTFQLAKKTCQPRVETQVRECFISLQLN